MENVIDSLSILTGPTASKKNRLLWYNSSGSNTVLQPINANLYFMYNKIWCLMMKKRTIKRNNRINQVIYSILPVDKTILSSVLNWIYFWPDSMNTFLGKSHTEVFMERFNEHFLREELQLCAHSHFLWTLSWGKASAMCSWCYPMNTFLGKSLSKVSMARFNEHFIAEEPQRSPHYTLLSTLFCRKIPSEPLMARSTH